MKSTTRCSLNGPFSTRLLTNGLWELTAARPDRIRIYLRPAAPAQWETLRDATLDRVDLHWQAESVAVNIIRANRVATLSASSAIVHEIEMTLYESLPLAAFDRNAQRFWKRVFRLIRIPGGRLLLGLLSRPKR